MMEHLQAWLLATRPKTLPAAVAPVLVASAMAWVHGGYQPLLALVCLLFALLIQIGTNFANDYLDGIKGADTPQRLGPQRAVATGLISAAKMRRASIAVLVLAFCLGLMLIPAGGWGLLVVGVLSVLCAWAYTGGPYPLAYNGLGDLFVVLFFGLVAVGCTFYVQLGTVYMEVCLLGLALGLLINNLLVVNNYRDVDEDRRHAKCTLVVRLGRPWALVQYALSALIALGVTFYLWWIAYGDAVLLACGPLIYSLMQVKRLRFAVKAVDFDHCLKSAAFVVVGYALILSAAIVVGNQ